MEEGNRHVDAASLAGAGRPCRRLDVVLRGVLAENEDHDGGASPTREGNTDLRVRLRSQRKDRRGPSLAEAARIAATQASGASTIPLVSQRRLVDSLEVRLVTVACGLDAGSRDRRSSMKAFAASLSPPGAAPGLSTMLTTRNSAIGSLNVTCHEILCKIAHMAECVSALINCSHPSFRSRACRTKPRSAANCGLPAFRCIR